MDNAQIAEALAITEHTVKFHVGNIYRKLGARSRTEAVLVALQEGIAEVRPGQTHDEEEVGGNG